MLVYTKLLVKYWVGRSCQKGTWPR